MLFVLCSVIWGVPYLFIKIAIDVVAGVVALGEHIGVVSIVGLALILLGSWISTGGSHPT
jgi:drug/metabolite transporter (DMT)-like permease